MLCACLASGYRATDAFIASTLQKHLFREMRLYDTAAHNKDALKWNAIPRRWGMNKSGEADEVVDEEPNPEGVDGDEKNPVPQYQRRIILRFLHYTVISVWQGRATKARSVRVRLSLSLVMALTDIFQSIFSTRTITAQTTL
jgi:hypothetical protein